MHALVEEIRRFEAGQVAARIPAGARVLEIGAGAGWQARELAASGFQVEAIDLGSNPLRGELQWPVREYDGRTIPFPDASFDVVFSSNVLEHVVAVEELQGEILRVLKPGGMAVHILPTPSWRLWTSLVHYPYLVWQLVRIAMRRLSACGEAPDPRRGALRKRYGAGEIVRRLLYAGRHGERGNALTEILYFRSAWWTGLFQRSGWVVVECRPLGLFYSGCGLFGSCLSIRRRERASRLLGSSTAMYCLVPSGRP